MVRYHVIVQPLIYLSTLPLAWTSVSQLTQHFLVMISLQLH